MKNITKKIKKSNFENKLFNMYFKDMSIGVFDIETTGLSPDFSKVILTGLLTFQEEEITVQQYLAESLSEEKDVLENTLKLLSSLDIVITYNGRSFDMPYIQARSAHEGLPWRLNHLYNLDLYKIVKGFSTLGQSLPNLKQKSIEKFMGIDNNRIDEISGGDSVVLFKDYLKTSEKVLEDKILLHNHDDILQLNQLLPIINYVDFHKAMSAMGFPVKNLLVKSIKLSRNQLIITGLQTKNLINYIKFPDITNPATINFNDFSGSFEVILDLESKGNNLYIDALALNEDVDPIKDLPSFVNGFYVIKTEDKIKYSDLNSFVIWFLNSLELS